MAVQSSNRSALATDSAGVPIDCGPPFRQLLIRSDNLWTGSIFLAPAKSDWLLMTEDSCTLVTLLFSVNADSLCSATAVTLQTLQVTRGLGGATLFAHSSEKIRKNSAPEISIVENSIWNAPIQYSPRTAAGRPCSQSAPLGNWVFLQTDVGSGGREKYRQSTGPSWLHSGPLAATRIFYQHWRTV